MDRWRLSPFVPDFENFGDQRKESRPISTSVLFGFRSDWLECARRRCWPRVSCAVLAFHRV